MKLVIYGSRGVSPGYMTIDRLVYQHWGVLPMFVISGRARGADRAGERWAEWRGIPVMGMAADWELNGRRAGFIRNTAMAEVATAGLGLWDGVSRGTQHMTGELTRLGRSLHVEVL